jgi:hypothetical protein
LTDWVAAACPAHLGAHRRIDCDDRPTIRNKIGCRYADPCSNFRNNVPNFDPSSAKPQLTRNDFTTRKCVGTTRLDPRVKHCNYMVCRYCLSAIEHEAWHVTAVNDFFGLQPHGSTSNSTNHFLTRLCEICEEREIALQRRQLVVHIRDAKFTGENEVLLVIFNFVS